MSYAEKTNVSSSQSKVEIEKMLKRYGAGQFMSGYSDDTAFVAFSMSDRQVRFRIQLPDRNSRDFTHTPDRNIERSADKQEKLYEQSIKQKWRALCLVIKAKLEAVEADITTFDEEFLAHISLPDGQTVGSYMIPQVKEAYIGGKMPKMLPAYMENDNAK